MNTFGKSPSGLVARPDAPLVTAGPSIGRLRWRPVSRIRQEAHRLLDVGVVVATVIAMALADVVRDGVVQGVAEVEFLLR